MGGVGAREGREDEEGVKREVDKGLGSNVDEARGLEVGGSLGDLGRGTSVAAAGVGGVNDSEGVLVRVPAGGSSSSGSGPTGARSEGDTTGVGGLPKRERDVRFVSTCVSNDIRETAGFSIEDARVTSGSTSSVSSSSSFSSEVSSADLSASSPKLWRTRFQAGRKDQRVQIPFHKLMKMRTRIKRLRLSRRGVGVEDAGAGSKAFPFIGEARPSGRDCAVSKPFDSIARDTESSVTAVEGRVRLSDFVRCNFGEALRPKRKMSVSSWDRVRWTPNDDGGGPDSVVGVVGWLASASYCLEMYPRVFIVWCREQVSFHNIRFGVRNG